MNDHSVASRRAGCKTPFRCVLGATIAVLTLPILIDLLRSRHGVERRLFAYAMPDTFYYLTVARNIGLHGRSSFDGEHVSNGYHPLWQLITSLPYALHLPAADTPWVLAYLLAISVVLQALALGFLARALRRHDGTLPWAFVGVPIGAYAFCVYPAYLSSIGRGLWQASWVAGDRSIFGTWWSYANGMETSLVLFFTGLVVWIASSPRFADQPARLGLALAGLSLARLDQGLLAAPILAGLCLHHVRRVGPTEDRLRFPTRALAAFAGPLVAYLLVNRIMFGAALPVSGSVRAPSRG